MLTPQRVLPPSRCACHLPLRGRHYSLRHAFSVPSQHATGMLTLMLCHSLRRYAPPPSRREALLPSLRFQRAKPTCRWHVDTSKSTPSVTLRVPSQHDTGMLTPQRVLPPSRCACHLPLGGRLLSPLLGGGCPERAGGASTNQLYQYRYDAGDGVHSLSRVKRRGFPEPSGG